MTVALIGPDGQKYTLTSDDPALLANAKAKGFRPEAEIGAIEEAVDTSKAAGAGALQGVTAGLFGAGLGAGQGDEETPESAQARWGNAAELSRLREEHPVAHGVGEFGGMLLSPVGEVGAGIRTGIGATTRAGRIAVGALSGAAEGSLFGAGNALSDAALGDVELTADKVIAGTGMGALLGLAGGGVGAGIEEGAKALLPKLSRSVGGAQGVLDELANDATIKAFRNTKNELGKFTPERLDAAATAARERGHLKLSPAEMGRSIAADVADTGAKKGAFLDRATGAPDWQAAIARLDQHSADLPPLEREAGAKAIAEARSALEDLATKPKGAGWREFDQWKRGLQERAKFTRGAVEDDMGLRLKRELAGVAREEVDRQLVPALGKEGPAFLDTKKLYGTLKDVERLAANGSSRPGGFSLSDITAGGFASLAHPAGIVTALAAKLMREHGAALVAKTADAISKSPALTAVAKSMGAQLGGLVPKLGPYGVSLAEAFARGPEMGLATHMAMAQVDPGYAATAHLAGLEAEGPQEHAAALERAHGLAAVSAAVENHAQELDRHIDRVLKATASPPATGEVLKAQDFGAKRMRREPEAAHEQRAQEIRQLAADPNNLVERVAGNFAEVGPVAPGLAAALTARAHVAVQYLAKAAEVPPKPGPLAREWTPTQAERHVFAQRLEVVEDPMSVLRHAAAGTLVEPQMEALRAVYPSLAKGIADRALEQALGAQALSYRARMMVTALTGVDVDGSLSQAAIASNQMAVHAKGQEKQDEPRTPVSRSEQTLAQMTALPQQRREMGDQSG